MDKLRKPFQGVLNIIRFNRHYYLLAVTLIMIALLLHNRLNDTTRVMTAIVVLLVVSSTLISLVVSCYIYDFSNLYTLSWLDNISQRDNSNIMNINAGFDETSHLLKNRFPNAALMVADFYHPAKHTEISIKRARKAYPPYPNTQQINTSHLPVANSSTDIIFLILSAHEIRNDKERILFFKELSRALSDSGKIIVTEHIRDSANFFAYNIGFFHFHSKATWLHSFYHAGLTVAKEIKITPFITTFILEKNGTAS